MDTKIEIKEEPWWLETTSAPHINSEESPSSEIAFHNLGVNLQSDIGTDEMDTKIELKEEPLYLKGMQVKSESEDVDLKSNISVTGDREQEHQLTGPTRLIDGQSHKVIPT